jgi:hypothetical protein
MNDDETFYLSQIPKPLPSRSHAPKVSSIVNRVIQQRGYAAVQSNAALSDAWNEAVGPMLGPQTRIGKLERGTLFIFAADAIVMTELEFMKSQILKAMQRRLPEFGIRGLRIKNDVHR